MNLNEIIEKYETTDEFVETLKQEVIKLGTENSNFIYNPNNAGRCFYNGPAAKISVDGNKTIVGPECKGCIFGQALQNMGWTDEHELSDTVSLRAILHNRNIYSETGTLLSIVQCRQDSGNSWGASIRPLIKNQV